MASNFDFLKKIDKELFGLIEDAQKLFRDEYFNQSCVQIRIFAEKTAKKALGGVSSEMTFDDTINCLKDKVQSQREKEFIEDLFFIKKEGNKCAHGEDATAITTLECLRRAFEVALSYAQAKKENKELDKLQFDESLLITQEKKRPKIVDEYLKRAQAEVDRENLLNSKQGEFIAQVDKSVDEDGLKNNTFISNSRQYSKEEKKKKTKKKKELSPIQLKIKNKVKEAKKNLKEKINTEEKCPKSLNKTLQKDKKLYKEKTSTKKGLKKPRGKRKNPFLKNLFFVIFFAMTLIFLIKLLFLY